MGIEEKPPDSPDLCEFCGEPEEVIFGDIRCCLKCAERLDNFTDGLANINPVIRLKEDTEVCGPYTKFDLIEKGWNPELWGYFLPKDFQKMWVSLSEKDVTLLSDNGVQVFKAEKESGGVNGQE